MKRMTAFDNLTKKEAEYNKLGDEMSYELLSCKFSPASIFLEDIAAKWYNGYDAEYSEIIKEHGGMSIYIKHDMTAEIAIFMGDGSKASEYVPYEVQEAYIAAKFPLN